MIELLRYLEANGFATFIVSGGGRDFMRPAASRLYDIPADRVVGSSFGLEYRERDGSASVVYSRTTTTAASSRTPAARRRPCRRRRTGAGR